MRSWGTDTYLDHKFRCRSPMPLGERANPPCLAPQVSCARDENSPTRRPGLMPMAPYGMMAPPHLRPPGPIGMHPSWNPMEPSAKRPRTYPQPHAPPQFWGMPGNGPHNGSQHFAPPALPPRAFSFGHPAAHAPYGHGGGDVSVGGGYNQPPMPPPTHMIPPGPQYGGYPPARQIPSMDAMRAQLANPLRQRQGPQSSFHFNQPR